MMSRQSIEVECADIHRMMPTSWYRAAGNMALWLEPRVD